MDTDNTSQISTLLNSVGLVTGGGGINWANLIAGFVFGIIGLFVFKYGWKEKAVKPLVIGLILMIYPYFIYNTFALYAIGIGLTAALYFWRD